MNVTELMLKLEKIRNVIGEVEVKIMVNGLEQDLELAVMDSNRIVIVSETEARLLPDDQF